MEKERYTEWVENSWAARFIDLLLVGNIQGLGLIDVELINEFPEIKFDSELPEDRKNKLRYITLSELWTMGAYEVIRLMRDIILKNEEIYSNETKMRLKEVLVLFEEIRVPLVKFQERHNNKLYSGITQPKFDFINGFGWEIIISNRDGVNIKMIYRNELADIFLELLKLFSKDVQEKSVKK